MSDEVKETPLDWDNATNEAQVLKNEALPIVSRAVKGTAEKNSDLEKKVAPLKETGFLEMSSQWLEQIEKNYPDCECIFCELVKKGYSLYTIGQMTGTNNWRIAEYLK